MIRSKINGRFDRLKWRTVLSAEFPGAMGDRESSYSWDDAVLDTGSPVHVLPGASASFLTPEQLRSIERAPVHLQLNAFTTEILSLPCVGMYSTPIGGVEGTPRWRHLFWALLDIPGIPNLDFVPVIFMDIPHPIISVGLCVESGMSFTFDANGFSVR